MSIRAHRASSRQSRRTVARACHSVERLERRTLLSTFVINGTNAGDVWFLDAQPGQVSVNGTTTMNPSITDVQVNGFDDNDALFAQNVSIPVVFNGGNGNDQLLDTNSNLTTITSQLSFNGGAGDDFAILHDDENATNSTYTFSGNLFDRNGYGKLAIDGTVENMILNTGKGNNAVYVQGLFWQPSITINGGITSDYVYVAMNGSTGTLNFDGGGGAGTDTLEVSDYNVIGPTVYNITSSVISRTGRTINYSNVESAQFQGSGASSGTYNVQSSLTPLSILGGTANDTFNLKLCNASTFAINGRVSVYGFGGADTLNFDGTQWTNTPLTFWLTPDSLSINSPTPMVTFSAIASLTLQGPSQATTSNSSYVVTGTAASITGQTTIVAGTGNNDVYVRPRDDDGNLQLPTPLGVFGGSGADRLIVEDSGSAAIDYHINNAGGTGTADVVGLGAAAIGAFSDVENLILNGGSGNDSYSIDTFKNGSGLTINGNAGYDVVSLTPGSGDLSANITSIASFLFDAGPDGGSFQVVNNNSTVPWTYTRTGDNVRASKSTGYFAVFNLINCSYAGVLGGSAVDQFFANSSPFGSNTNFSGGGGNDQYTIGQSGLVGQIRGWITCEGTFGGTDADTVIIDDSADNVGRTVHVTPRAVSDSIGDTLFGGPDSGVGLNSIRGLLTLRLGSGADAVYALPSTITPMLIQANNPTSAPGDRMNVATAPLINPVYNDFGGGSGEITYVGTPGFHFNGIETANFDNLAPTVLSQDFESAAAGQSIVLRFSEDVSRSLFPSSVQVVDQTDPLNFIDADALQYDAATNTATFGFAALPSGSYYVAIDYHDTRDLFGNPMAAAPTRYNFTWASGTEGPDQFRLSRDGRASGYFVYLNDDTSPAFVGSPDTAKIVLAGEGGDDLLVVDLSAGDPIPADGLVIDGGDGTDTLGVVSAGGDYVSFDQSTAVLNGSQVDHANVEDFSFQSTGEDYATLAVNSGNLALAGTQRFDSLSINDGATVTMAADGLLIARALTLQSAATLDLGSGDLLLQPPAAVRGARTRGGDPLATIQALINSGRRGGAWDGFGITSSAARDRDPRITTLGAMRGSDYLTVRPAFDGESVSAEDVLVKYTYYGDADFNGKVNFDDYTRIDAGFNANRGGWINGDFNGNAKVNFDDYTLIDAAFNAQSGVL